MAVDYLGGKKIHDVAIIETHIAVGYSIFQMESSGQSNRTDIEVKCLRKRFL